MTNVIFGSGIIGLLAKAMLGEEWTVIPFKRSRFFSFSPALDDNFIIANDETHEFVRDVSQAIHTEVVSYRRAWSVDGQLIPAWNKILCEAWLAKIFGSQIPPQSLPYYTNRMTLPIYNLQVNKLYSSLLSRYDLALRTEVAKGDVTEIGNHYIIRNGVRTDFDNAISTIPLPALRTLMKLPDLKLPTKSLHYYLVNTPNLDFEGYNQQFVVDAIFDFYRVSQVMPNHYLFYCYNNITSPGQYFMPILQNFDIIDGTSMTDALPMGPIPQLEFYEKLDIHCVGSYAQWDWCMDVGSCILRLQRLAQRNFTSNKKPLGTR